MTAAADTSFDPLHGTPGRPEGGSTLAMWIREQMAEAKPVCERWKAKAKEMDRYRAGKYFSDQDLQQLNDEGRPAAVFDAAQKWSRYICGLEQQSQVEIQFLPRNPHDEAQTMGGSLATKGYEWAIQACNGSFERSTAFDDMLWRGMGFTYWMLDRSHDICGMAVLTRVDGMEMLWDPRAKKACLEDARWMARERKISKSEAMRRWGREHAGAILAGGSDTRASGMPDRSTLISEQRAIPIEGEAAWPALRPHEIGVTEFQWYEEIEGVYYYDPFSGKDEWLATSEFNSYRRRYLLAVRALRAAQPDRDWPDDLDRDYQIGREYKGAVLIGNTIVSGPVVLPDKNFSWNTMTGQRDEEMGIWYGFMRLIVDPQKYMTKFANQMMEIMTRSAKGGLLAEEDAFVNPREAEMSWARTGSFTLLRPGGLGKVQQKEPPQLPQGSVDLFKLTAEMLREVTGINPETAMGTGSGDVPMVTLQQRQRASQLLLATEFSSLKRYRVKEAKTGLAYLRLIADDRWIRVGGPYESQALQLVKDPLFVDYDVVMDEHTKDPQAREEYLMTLKEMFPALMRFEAFVPEFIDFLPWPAAIKHSIKQAMARQEKAKMQQAQQGLVTGGRGKPTTQAEVQARAQKVQAEAMRARAQAIKTMESIGTDKGRMLLDAFMSWLEMEQRQAEANQKAGLAAMDGASNEMITMMQTAASMANRGGEGK